MTWVQHCDHTEMEKISDQCLRGEISAEEYWQRWEAIKAEGKRQEVRDKLDRVLNGTPVSQLQDPDRLWERGDLDARLRNVLRTKFA